MFLKKSFIKSLSCVLVAVTAISLSACKKQTKEQLKVVGFDAQVSINHYEVETYLNYTGTNHVGGFLPLTPNYRHDQGKPVTVSYELPESCKNEIIEKTEILVYSDEACKNLVQTANNSNREAYIDVYNLIPETTYYFKVSAKMSGGKTLSGTGTFTTAKGVRFLKLDGASNVRDFGGWKTQDGKTIKYGVLFRGGEIDGGKNANHPDFCLTEEGINTLRSFNIKTDFDLRSPNYPVGQFSILGEDVTRKVYDFGYYANITNNINSAKVRNIFTDIANPNAFPAYVHCTHGVDRAGTFSAILQGLLGLSTEDIIRDYELSAFYHNYRHINRYAEQENSSIVELIEALNEYEGETFSEKVANFLKGVGITDEQINTIKTIFLEG